MKPRPSFPVRMDRVDTAATRPGLVRTGRPVGSLSASSWSRLPPSTQLATGWIPARTHEYGAKAGRAGHHRPPGLSAFNAIERHRFVDSALVNQAYEDTSLPIGLGQTISKPGVVSRMIELLRNGAPGKLGRVLEIGTGCGYQAALLSLVATEVYSIERLRGLHDKARENLRHLRLANLHLLFGDGMAGYAKGAPYAGIIAAAGGDAVPQAWVDQLAMGGRLVAPVAAVAGAMDKPCWFWTKPHRE